MIEDYSFNEGFMPDGSVVVFPTDTVFGLACRLYDIEALDKIYSIKKDEKNHYYAVLCDTIVSVNDLAIIDENARKLMMKFWPGALTIILKSSPAHLERTGFEKIGVRIPNHEAALELIKKNGPLVTTSLKLSNNKPVTNIQEVMTNFSDKVDHVYEEYSAFYLNVCSTTVDMSDNEIKYLRIGTISKEAIEHELIEK